MTDPDPYEALFAEITAEWANDEDAIYLSYYPETTPTKENNR